MMHAPNNKIDQESDSDIMEFLKESQKNQQEMRLEMQEIKSLLSRLASAKAAECSSADDKHTRH